MKEKINRETVLPMTTGQMKDIIATMVGGLPGLTKAQADKAIGSKGKIVEGVKKIFEQFIGNKYPIYPVTIDYSRSLAQMIEAGKYDWVDNDINDKNFSNELPRSKLTGNYLIKGEGKKDTDIVLYHFNKYVESDEAIALMQKEGYHPANLEELLALGEKYPDLQKQFPIVALGSVWRGRVPCLFGDGVRPVRGDCLVPYVISRVVERGLNLCYFGRKWNDSHRFAAVRE